MIKRTVDITPFVAAYPAVHAKFRLSVDQSSFSINNIATIIQTLPPALTFCRSGDYPIAAEQKELPAKDIDLASAFKNLASDNFWICLRKIASHADYAQLLDDVLAPLMTAIETKTGNLNHKETQLLVSSPNAMTPLRMDIEHGVYIQLKGSSKYTIFNAGQKNPPRQAEIEELVCSSHRHLDWHEAYKQLGTQIVLTPGDALFIPAFVPFWGTTSGLEPSHCLKIRCQTRAISQIAKLHMINHAKRQSGKTLSYPGDNPMRDIATLIEHNFSTFMQK